MCGIVGFKINNPTNDDFKLVERFFIESKIRGLHATGCSYVNKEQKIITIKTPEPADKFIKQIDLSSMLDDKGNLNLIGHCRYSTSDLVWNQPIADDEYSIVHNGVITQEPSELWKEHFGIECKTKNDSELLFHTLKNKDVYLNVYERWKDSSIACISLDKNKEMSFFRNGKRPLYYSFSDENLFIYSTKDIAKRAGLEGESIQCDSNEMIKVIEYNETTYVIHSTYWDTIMKDLQNAQTSN